MPKIYYTVVCYCRLIDTLNFLGDARHPPILARTMQIARKGSLPRRVHPG